MDGGAGWAAVHGVAKSWTRLSDFTFTFHFHALEKEMATHSSVLAWRIPGMGKTGGLPSMGSHRVSHNWSDLAAAEHILKVFIKFVTILLQFYVCFFDPEACMILARWPGIEHTPPALEDEGLTTGLPGKSINIFHVYTHTRTHTHTHTHTYIHIYIFHISHWTVTFLIWLKEGVTEQSLLWLKIHSLTSLHL